MMDLSRFILDIFETGPSPRPPPRAAAAPAPYLRRSEEKHTKALTDRLAADHQLTYVIYRNGARRPGLRHEVV